MTKGPAHVTLFLSVILSVFQAFAINFKEKEKKRGGNAFEGDLWDIMLWYYEYKVKKKLLTESNICFIIF